MSTITTAQRAARPPAPSELGVTQSRVIRSEWIKFRSLRSTRYTLAIAVALMVAIGVLATLVMASHYDRLSATEKADFNPVTLSLAGTLFAQLATGVLGVLFISSEYTTGMIRSSLTAVPRRLPVLWGKVAVFGGFIGAVSIITSFVAFFAGQAMLATKHLDVSITSPEALRKVIGAGLYLTVAGIVGMAIGAILRNSAGGIATFVGLFFVLPPVLGFLPRSWSDSIAKYLPARAGEAIWNAPSGAATSLAPWVGFGLLCLYALVLLGFAASWLRRRDT